MKESGRPGDERHDGGTEHAKPSSWTHLKQRLGENGKLLEGGNDSQYGGTAGDHFPWQDSHRRKDDYDDAPVPPPTHTEEPTKSERIRSESGQTIRVPLPRTRMWKQEFVSNTIAGVLSGCSAALLVAPLEVVKTRLQAQTPGQLVRRPYRGIKDALRRILIEEGPRGLYRGLGPTLFGLIPTWAIYWPAYDVMKASIKSLECVRTRNMENSPIVHLSAAITSGAITSACTNPLWVIKTRLMVQHHTHERHYKSSFHAFGKIFKEEGLRGYYKGFSAGLLGLSHVAVQFPVYEYILGKLGTTDVEERHRSMLNVGLASLLAKATASTITYPHEVIRTRLQNETTPPRKYYSLPQTARLIWREEGYCGMYRGLLTNLCRTIPAGVVTFVTYELSLKEVRALVNTLANRDP